MSAWLREAAGSSTNGSSPRSGDEGWEYRSIMLRSFLLQSRWNALAWKCLCRHRWWVSSRVQILGDPDVTGPPPLPVDQPVGVRPLTSSTNSTGASSSGLHGEGTLPPPPPAVPAGPVGLPLSRPAEGQADAPPDISAPPCPQCGSRMRQRLSHNKRGHYWGCPRVPRCVGNLRPGDDTESFG